MSRLYVVHTSRRGNSFGFDPETKWVRVERNGHVVERGTYGKPNPGAFADRLLARLKRIERAFEKAEAMLRLHDHPAYLEDHLEKLADLHRFWTVKGRRWREARTKTYHTIRFFKVTKEVRAEIRDILVNAEMEKRWVAK